MENLKEEDKDKFLRLSAMGAKDDVAKFVASKLTNLPELASKAADETIDQFNQLLKAQ